MWECTNDKQRTFKLHRSKYCKTVIQFKQKLITSGIETNQPKSVLATKEFNSDKRIKGLSSRFDDKYELLYTPALLSIALTVTFYDVFVWYINVDI